MHDVLSGTRAGTTSSGGPSKVAYELDPALASRVHGQAADLLSGFPLYPAVDLG
jgi:glycine hydroxymethyltransferase